MCVGLTHPDAADKATADVALSHMAAHSPMDAHSKEEASSLLGGRSPSTSSSRRHRGRRRGARPDDALNFVIKPTPWRMVAWSSPRRRLMSTSSTRCRKDRDVELARMPPMCCGGSRHGVRQDDASVNLIKPAPWRMKAWRLGRMPPPYHGGWRHGVRQDDTNVNIINLVPQGSCLGAHKKDTGVTPWIQLSIFVAATLAFSGDAI